jgi:glutamate 5-kinase
MYAFGVNDTTANQISKRVISPSLGTFIHKESLLNKRFIKPQTVTWHPFDNFRLLTWVRMPVMSRVERNQKLKPLNDLSSARRVVIKVGTNTVTGGASGFNFSQMRPVVRSLVKLHREGRQVVLVSSGAVGLGATKLDMNRVRLQNLVMRQACAAAGQSLLMNAYERLFGKYDVKIGQVLLTEADFSNWQRYSSLRRTMEKLLKLRVLPIVNENDTVSTAELEYVDTESSRRVFSDNDHLAALITIKLEADALIMLTNVDGVLSWSTQTKNLADAAEVVPLITEVSPELKKLARGHSQSGRGGMLTKLQAAEIAMRNGAAVVIANGAKPKVLEHLFAGEQIGTFFPPHERLKGKRRWIAHAAEVRGRVMVNQGAREAIVNRKASLLASGVMRVEQDFQAKDVVSIVDTEGREIARGLINCSRRQAEDLVRLSISNQTKGERLHILVTRNNLVLSERQ